MNEKVDLAAPDKDIINFIRKELEKNLILQDVYHKNETLWARIIDAEDPEEMDDLPISIEEYLYLVRETDKFSEEQRRFHHFMIDKFGLGYYGSSDDWGELDDYSIADYQEEFGVTPKDALYMKILHDQEIPDVSSEFERIS